MSVESPKQEPDDGALAGMQDTLESDQIAFVDTLDDEITTVIEQASSLQRYEYVVGTVDDVWTSPENHRHFDLIQYNETTEMINQIHCVIFNARRSSITTDIIEGRQLAVAGTVSFHPPGGYGSILVEEVASLDEDDGSHLLKRLRTDRHIQIAIATVLLLLVGLLASSLLLL